MQVDTNHHWRQFKNLDELSKKQQTIAREDYDWVDDIYTESFIVYYGQVLTLSDFVVNGSIDDWDGYYPQGHGCGYVINVSNEDPDQYQIGWYH